MKTADFVAYYRVSTDKQGVSGLGLEAQRSAVSRFVAGKGRLVLEYTEIESGKSHKNRPQLQAALDACKKRKAKLVIAKLDRLARNVHFISGLMESGVEFTACDMPQANKLTIHIFAAVAENEREMISARTKAALAEAKARGKQLGNPRWEAALQAASKARKLQPCPEPLIRMMLELRAQGKTFRAITAQLNELGLTTASGSKWYASTVRNTLVAAAKAPAAA